MQHWNRELRRVLFTLGGVFLILLIPAVRLGHGIEPPVRVLLISLDGGRPDGIQQANTPNIDHLASCGAASWQASTIFPPATLPAHASMLTGLSVGEHRVLWNFNTPLAVQSPTFISQAQDAGFRSAMVVGKEKLEQFHQRDEVAFTFAREGDRSVVDRIIELLRDDYAIIFAHFPNPDFFGHRDGWMSDTYIFELSNTDRQIGRLLETLDELELRDETLILITADHGGHGKSHGQDIPEDMLIPWIIAGPGVVPGTELGPDISVADTAPTLLWALGLPLPETDFGQPVYAAFGLDAPADTPPRAVYPCPATANP